ncbi:WD40-repeat-containing domain protein, partial [Dichomitus squalens]
SLDSEWIATGSDVNAIILWDANGRVCHERVAHGGRVNSLAFSPDNQHLASTGEDYQVAVLNLGQGHSLLFRGHTDQLEAIAFNPDSTRLATASNDHTVRVWDVQTGASHVVLQQHLKGVEDATFSPDGKLLLSASSDKTIKI